MTKSSTLRAQQLFPEFYRFFATKEGFLGEELEGVTLLAPVAVKVEGDTVFWTPAQPDLDRVYQEDVEALRSRMRSSVRGALDEFLVLAMPTIAGLTEGDAVENFVRKWGPLGLCHHGAPYTHAPGSSFAYPDSSSPLDRLIESMKESMAPRCNFVSAPSGWYCEPLLRWRYYARLAVIVLDDAVDMRPDSRSPVHDPASQQRLTNHLNQWLSDGAVSVRLMNTSSMDPWPAGLQWHLQPNIFSIFGVLAVQLGQAVTSSRAIYSCGGCGKLFTPTPRQRPYKEDHLVFCKQCGRPAAVRLAQRRFRANSKKDTGQ